MSGKKKEIFCILLLIILGLTFFYQTFYFDFFDIDDYTHTSESIAVKSFNLKNILTQYSIGLYHPLTTLSFAVDWWLGGGTPSMFHLSNFIFHLLGTLVLFKICLRLWPRQFLLGLLISLSFLLHPLRGESVAWVSERKDVLSGLFLWLTIYLYLFYLEQRKLWQYILANLAFLLALAGKVSVVGLPIFLFVIDWYRNQKLSLRSLISKTPFFLLSLLFGMLNVLEQARMRANLNLTAKHHFDIFYQMQFYIEKFFFPWNLRPWYSLEFLKFNPTGIVAVFFICFLAILILKKFPAQRQNLFFGLSMFAIFLFPNLRILPSYSDTDIVHDRYLYIASTGLAFAFFPFILQSIGELWRKEKQIFSFILGGVFASMMLQWLSLMYLQIPYWKNSITLWERTATLEPNSSMVSGYFGDALLRAGRYEEALYHLQKSYGRVEDFESLGYVLAMLNKPQEAETIVLEGLELYPDHSLLLNMLGAIRFDRGYHHDALKLFNQALQNLRDEQGSRLRAMILNNLGLANMQFENLETAESFFRQALALYNTEDKIIKNLELVLLKQNRLK